MNSTDQDLGAVLGTRLDDVARAAPEELGASLHDLRRRGRSRHRGTVGVAAAVTLAGVAAATTGGAAVVDAVQPDQPRGDVAVGSPGTPLPRSSLRSPRITGSPVPPGPRATAAPPPQPPRGVVVPGYTNAQLVAIAAGCGREIGPNKSGDSVRSIFRDRAGTVAFLVGPTSYAACEVQPGNKPGNSTGSQAAALGPLRGPLSVDVSIASDAREGGTWSELYGGRVGKAVSRVVITSADGRRADAAVMNGTFVGRLLHPGKLPEGLPASTIRAYDADGRLLWVVDPTSDDGGGPA